MKPTLSVFHRTDNTERIGFACDHASMVTSHLGGDGGSLRAALEGTVAMHHVVCRCEPEVYETLYESMAYMRAQMEGDLRSLPAGADMSVVALCHQTLDTLSRHECPCDPHVIETATIGMVKLVTYHREGCSRKPSKERRFRFLDLTEASA